MTGKELKTLCFLNDIKTYDIANTLGYSHTTMTRLCQPTRVLEENTVVDILGAMKQLKGDIITSVTISDAENLLKTLD